MRRAHAFILTEKGSMQNEELALRLNGWRLATAEVLYYLPDHPSLLQSFVWQTLDLAPSYPRIHRFLRKPVNLSLLQQALASALERYARLARLPGLARGERGKRGRDSAQARSFLERIKALGGRFARAIGGAGR